MSMPGSQPGSPPFLSLESSFSSIDGSGRRSMDNIQSMSFSNNLKLYSRQIGLQLRLRSIRMQWALLWADQVGCGTHGPPRVKEPLFPSFLNWSSWSPTKSGGPQVLHSSLLIKPSCHCDPVVNKAFSSACFCPSTSTFSVANISSFVAASQWGSCCSLEAVLLLSHQLVLGGGGLQA